MTRKELVLVPCDKRWRRLPVARVKWLDDTPAPRRHVPGNKGKTYRPEPLTPSELLRLMAAVPGYGGVKHRWWRVGVRDRALIAFLARTGLRISEALALLPHHVDFKARTVTVMCGKNSKYRVSGVDDWALAELGPWLFERAKLGIPDTAPLFCTVTGADRGRPMSATSFRRSLHEYGRRAGIPKRVHPHGLRHSHACDLAREGVGMHLISRQLGHSNLGTTATYLGGIAPFEVIDAIAARSAPR